MIEHSIDENGILHVDFKGEIDFTAIAKWLAQFSEIHNLPLNLYLIYDLRNANLKLDAANLIKIAKRTDEATQDYKSIRTAFLINKNKLTAYTTLFTFLRSNRRTIRKAYSEMGAAYNWLMEEKGKLFGNYNGDLGI